MAHQSSGHANRKSGADGTRKIKGKAMTSNAQQDTARGGAEAEENTNGKEMRKTIGNGCGNQRNANKHGGERRELESKNESRGNAMKNQ